MHVLCAGNGYDVRHAQFRTPVNGIYQFYVSMATRSGYTVAVDIMLNGSPVVKMRTGNDNQFNTATNSIILKLSQGDDVWVEHDTSITDSNRLFHDEGKLSTFSGHLVSRS